MTEEPGSLPDAEFPSSPKTRSAKISATTAIKIRTPKSANTPPDCHNMVARAYRLSDALGGVEHSEAAPYGRRMPITVILAHLLYGAILGAFYRLK